MNNYDLQQMRDTLHHNSGYIEDRPNGKIVYEDQVQVPARVKPTRKPSVGGGMRELPAATPQGPVATLPVVQPALQFPGEGRGYYSDSEQTRPAPRPSDMSWEQRLPAHRAAAWVS